MYELYLNCSPLYVFFAVAFLLVMPANGKTYSKLLKIVIFFRRESVMSALIVQYLTKFLNINP